jgi:cell volume regulation protein A
LSIDLLDTALFAGAAVMLAAILAVRVSLRAGLPSLLFYLGLGVLLGEAVIGVEFSDAALAHALGFGALILILAEGGLTTRWDDVRPAMGLGALLATLGVTVSVACVAVPAHYLLGLDWQLAVLLGAVTSPTDAAAVFSVLRHVPLRPSIRGVLEAESGLNDAPIVTIVTLVSAGSVHDHGIGVLVLMVAAEVCLGAAFGLAVGWLGARLMSGVALPSPGLYPLAVLALAIFAYAGASMLHLSGFAAVYLAALLLGNAELPHRVATRSFAEGVGWIAQIGLFVMLGLLASPARLEWWHVWTALIAGGLLTFVARPLSVMSSAMWWRIPMREQTFIGWAGLRGAVPIVLSTIPLAAGVEDATDLFDIVFILVVVYTLLQGPTLGWVADLMGVTVADQAREIEVEAAPLERVSADLLEVLVPPASRLHGVEVGELRLPAGASLSLIVRGDESFVPERVTRIQRGDGLIIVTPRQHRSATEERLRALSRHGRLATWRQGEIS